MPYFPFPKRYAPSISRSSERGQLSLTATGRAPKKELV